MMNDGEVAPELQKHIFRLFKSTTHTHTQKQFLETV